jgi:23S rRNA pseudouridine2605 synthase
MYLCEKITIMSRDSQGPRKTFSKGGSSDFNKRKSFSGSDKPKRPYKSEGSTYKKRDEDTSEKRSYTKRDDGDKSFSGEKRPYGKRSDGSFRSKSSSSFGSEKRSYTRRDDNDSPRNNFGDGEKKAFIKRADGKYESATPRRSFGEGEKRPYKRRDEGSEDRPRRNYGDEDRKPFVKRADGKYESTGPRKSYGDGEKRTYIKREDSSESRQRKSFDDGERKPYAKREEGEKRPYTRRDDSERPKRNFGDAEKRSYSSDRKPAERKLSPSEKVVVKSKKAGPSKTSDQKNVEEGAIRLNRYIANAGVCSRREADVLIATGVVTVNGKIVTEMGYKVNPTDVVNYGGVPIKNETKKYLLLNKPKDYITTMDDPEERRTVLQLTKQACKERLYPVGRLDRNTTGVLLFTNDGDLTAKLTHPKFDVRKVYHVTLNKKITTEDYRAINDGIELADGFIKPDAVEHVGTGKFELGVEIHSGRNRIVRRMFEHLGYEVVKLDRVAFAGLTKKDLPRGKYRFLTEKEVSFLKMLG